MFYKTLKPGGLLDRRRGTRAGDGLPQDPKASQVVMCARTTPSGSPEKAGFKVVGRSELLNNPKDTKDYPEGVCGRCRRLWRWAIRIAPVSGHRRGGQLSDEVSEAAMSVAAN